MSIKASIDKKYLWRLALISVAFFGIALWFLYDGMISYPRQQERQRKRVAVYDELKETGRESEWPAAARQRGWPIEIPEKPKTDAQIVVQKIIAGIAAFPGVLYAVFFCMARGTWVELSQSELKTSGGKHLTVAQIITLDKKKWKNKGIAKIRYEENGRKCRAVLDDWKYEAEPTRAILREIETHLDDSQIVGGARDPVPEAEGDTENPEAEGNREASEPAESAKEPD